MVVARREGLVGQGDRGEGIKRLNLIITKQSW